MLKEEKQKKLEEKQKRLNEMFCDAMEVGDIDIVKKLVKKGANINTVTSTGISAIRMAYLNKNNEIVKFLVEKGADINLQDKNGKTALFDTAELLDVEMGKYFIDHGATVDLSDKNGKTALTESIEHKGSIEYVKMVVENANKTILPSAETMFSDPHVWEKRDRYLDFVNGKNGAKSPLTLAGLSEEISDEEKIEKMRYLLNNSAQIDRKDENGRTTLMELAQASKVGPVTKFLLENGANERLTDKEGKTCFDLCGSKTNDRDKLEAQVGYGKMNGFFK